MRSIGFQSRLTLRGTIECLDCAGVLALGRWIKPYTDEAFEELAKKGVR